jgi:hypothetical protein
MIDVNHSSTTDLRHLYGHANDSQLHDSKRMDGERSSEAAQEQDDEEAAWLQRLQASGVGTVTQVKGLEPGTLIMDTGRLR